MSKERPTDRDNAHHHFLSLIPGPHSIDGDWNVDGPSVVRSADPQSLLAWMADARRPQPIMTAYTESVDDDA